MGKVIPRRDKKLDKSNAVAKLERRQVAHIPTEEERMGVAGMVSVGTEHWVIAHILGISEPTLYRHYAHELKHGRAIVHGKISKGIAQLALDGDKTMMMFYAKAQMGWRERNETVTIGADGKPVDPTAPVTVVLVNYGSKGTT
jgi:hypothetical protein